MGPGEPECFCHRINISAFWGSTVFSFGVRRAKMKEKELLNTAGHGDCRLQGWVGSPEMAKRRLCYSQCYTRRQIIQSSSRAFQSLPLKGHPPDNLSHHEGYVYTMGIHSKKENTLFSYCRQGKWLKVHQWEQYSRINCMIYSICPIHFCFPLPIFYPFSFHWLLFPPFFGGGWALNRAIYRGLFWFQKLGWPQAHRLHKES